MDMDGPVWTAHVSEYGDPVEGVSEDSECGEMWSPSTSGSGGTRVVDVEGGSPGGSSGPGSTVFEREGATANGSREEKGSGEIELIPV